MTAPCGVWAQYKFQRIISQKVLDRLEDGLQNFISRRQTR